MITVATYPLHTRLVSVSRFMEETQTPAAQVDRLPALLQRASDAVVRYCNREFVRGTFSETVAGFGSTTLLVSRRPVVAVSTVSASGTTVADYEIRDADAGMLFRRFGWEATSQVEWYLTGTPRPGTEDQSYTVAYTGGYLVLDDDRHSPDLAILAVDQSLNDAEGLLPLLVAGDRVTLSGFQTAGNNGIFVVATRTATKITFATGSGLTDEAAGSGGGMKSMQVATLPGDVVQATIETAKGWERGRLRDPNVKTKSVGDLSITYATGGGSESSGISDLPVSARLLLEPWRAAV